MWIVIQDELIKKKEKKKQKALRYIEDKKTILNWDVSR